jgi:hypothetical protein
MGRSASYWVRLFAGATAIALTAGVGVAEIRPVAVSPWPADLTPSQTATENENGSTTTSSVSTVSIYAAANHIVDQQCPNGGFGWPHDDCSATYNNITAPICLGVMCAYERTSDPDHLAAAIAGGDYDLTSQYGNGEARFGAFAPYFLMRLSQLTGDAQYSTFAATGFFDELTAGTYGPDDLDTAGWISLVQTARTGVWINLRPWEFHTIAPTATAIGNAGQDALFIQGILDGLNTLDNSDPFAAYYDYLGWAGAVRGLALTGTTTFPAINSPNHSLINGIDNLKDLADLLAAQQNGNGSWYWHSALVGPTSSDEDTQVTAYAVMALDVAGPVVGSDYSGNVSSGATWLHSMLLPSGGFMSYPGGSENTEVEGEALNALCTQPIGIPTVSEWGVVVLVLLTAAVGTVVFGFTRRRNEGTSIE